MEGAATSKAGCRHALLLLLLLEAQLVLTRQGSVQAARRQVHALTAARGCGSRVRVPQSAAARWPQEAPIAADRHARRAGRRGLAAPSVRLGQLLLGGGVQVTCLQRQAPRVSPTEPARHLGSRQPLRHAMPCTEFEAHKASCVHT